MQSNQDPNSNALAPGQRYPLQDNLENINSIKRMWRAQWPEFSWLTVPGDAASRCFQMFAPDISRIGYGEPQTDHGDQCWVWAVMCPQQGVWISAIEGTLNVEVTVTGAGGWVDESAMTIDAQISVTPKIWFSPDTVQNNELIRLLWKLFDLAGLQFPSSKETAIVLDTYGVDQKDQPGQSIYLNITDGLDPNYTPPSFALHNQPDIYDQVAAATVYLAVEIGKPQDAGHELINWFNGLVMDIFNLASGNMLQEQNVLSWNVWVIAPEEVLTQEWAMHAEYWRFSIDVNHRSPEGNGRDPMYADGKPFSPEVSFICNKLEELKNRLSNEGLFSHLPIVKDIEQELNNIISKNCGGGVKFL